MMIKKRLLRLLFVPLFLVNCDNEPYEGELIVEDNSCEIATQASVSAAEDYALASEEDFSILCQAYRDALENQIEKCGDEDGMLQTSIDSLGECSIINELCDEAIIASQIARQNYLAAQDDNFEGLCNTYKDTLEYQIEVCGDDGSLQTLINELGNCELNADPCEEAIEATGIAEEAYNNFTEDNFEAICNAYKDALMSQIEICGDIDGNLQLIIDQLGDCVPEDIVPIEGTWVLNFILISSQLDIDNDEQETINIYAEMNCHEIETVEFYEDGTGEFYRSTLANYSYVNNSGSADGVDFIVTCSELNTAINFNWVRVDNNIFAMLEGGTTITFLKSPNVLSLFIPDGFSANNVDNISPNIIHDISYVYYKE
ncbi:hypothetical protein [uncultured Winogradskyella sp.]|uniref:hypothetical protein n=1 Tax=uncultured Winogradskyella sp. TaxID=395353 RepID=UPI00261E541D|nr:hypothetical protein [uncultured Winogradskyella sp.]